MLLFQNANNIYEQGKQKANDPNRFIYQFTDKLSLKNPTKNMALANLSIYYTWKNIKFEYNKLEFCLYLE